MTRQRQTLAVLVTLIFILAACGGSPQPTATLPPPTATDAPTRAPVPTVAATPTPDMASLSVEELRALEDALVGEIAIEQRRMDAASGAEGAQIQVTLDRLNQRLREVRGLIETAGGSEATEEATSEAGS